MKLRGKLLNTFAATAMLMGMTGGMAFAADDSDSADTNLNVICPVTSQVDVEVNGNFEVNTSSYAPTYDAHLPGGFQITLDLSCNWSTDFQVSATIGTFQFQGVAPPLTASAFGGSHLLLDNGSGSYSGPNIYLLAGPPNVEGTVFEFLQTSDPDVIENGYDTFIFWNVPTASPGVTVATWDGHLYLLPGNLATGTYTAPLTVELTVN